MRYSSEPVPMNRTSYAPASHKAAIQSTGSARLRARYMGVTLLPNRTCAAMNTPTTAQPRSASAT